MPRVTRPSSVTVFLKVVLLTGSVVLLACQMVLGKTILSFVLRLSLHPKVFRLTFRAIVFRFNRPLLSCSSTV